MKKIENSIYQDWNRILKGEINSELLILGSSRGVVCYNPRILEEYTSLSSHNLSFNAGGYNLQELIYEVYLERNEKPKILVQNIDLTHFGVSKRLPDEHQFLPFYSDKLISKKLVDFENSTNDNEYIPLLKYNGNLKYLKRGLTSFLGFNQHSVKIIDGYSPKRIEFRKDSHSLIRLKKMMDFEGVDISSFKKIKRMVKTQLTKNVKVVLVWAPEHKNRLI